MDQITSNLFLSSVFHSKLKSKLANNEIENILSILSTDIDKTEGVTAKYDLISLVPGKSANNFKSESSNSQGRLPSQPIQHSSTDFTKNEINYKSFTTIIDAPKSAPIIKQILPECLKFIHNSRTNRQNVLVHCVAGKSRSATVIIAYLMTITNLDFQTVYDRVLEKREGVQPNFGFLSMLAKLKVDEYQTILEIGKEDFEQEKMVFFGEHD